jgi:Fe2+ or Zn2+ uptake regulation protein
MKLGECKSKILELLSKAHLMSLADLNRELKEVDYSTVFRNVEQLVAAGKVKAVVLGKKLTMYELADHRHDHFVCVDCGAVEPVDLLKLDRVLPRRAVLHDVLLKGLCADCNH